jgi:tetratricopeptide (TPR) repeat protein
MNPNSRPAAAEQRRRLAGVIPALWALAALALGGCLARADIHPEAARLNRRAASALAAGRLVAAEKVLAVALEYNPCYAAALHNLALVAYCRGRLDAAAQLEREALACRPDLVQAVNGLGAIALRQGRLQAAAAWFESALALDPGYLDARRNLIRTARLLGETDLAAEEQARLQALTAARKNDARPSTGRRPTGAGR